MRVRLAAIAVAAAIASLALPGPAAADVVSPAGTCSGKATWQAGGRTADSQQLTPDDVVTIPRADTVAWSATVEGRNPGATRAVAGRVSLRLPPPFGTVAIADWGGPTTVTTTSGRYAYSLPSLVPAGVVLGLEVAHDEAGQRYCTAQVGLITAGGPFASPLIWLDLGLLLASAAVLVMLGRSVGRPGAGRITGGALAGVPVGLFAGITLVLFGVIPLASPVVTILLIAGPVLGAAWTRWAPLGRSAFSAPST
jgi:hypothetical protein